MRTLCTLLLLAFAAPAVLAQTPAPAAPPAAGLQRDEVPADRKNQKIEHIHVEDAGASVDEVRVGGQTQSITVQPKADVPAYEVQPSDGVRARAPSRESSTGGGARVWNALKF